MTKKSGLITHRKPLVEENSHGNIPSGRGICFHAPMLLTPRNYSFPCERKASLGIRGRARSQWTGEQADRRTGTARGRRDTKKRLLLEWDTTQRGNVFFVMVPCIRISQLHMRRKRSCSHPCPIGVLSHSQSKISVITTASITCPRPVVPVGGGIM